MRCDVHMPKLISLVCWNPNLYARSECWHWVSSFILNIGSMHCDKCQHYPENTFGVYPELSRCLGSFLLKKKLFLSCIQVNRWASGWTSTTSRRWRNWRRSRKTRWWTSPRSTKPWKPGFASDMALTFTLPHTHHSSHTHLHMHIWNTHMRYISHTHTSFLTPVDFLLFVIIFCQPEDCQVRSDSFRQPQSIIDQVFFWSFKLELMRGGGRSGGG